MIKHRRTFRMDNLKEKVSEIIEQAGAIIVNTELRKEHIEVKGPANFVTEVDYKVQEFLVKELQNILAESNFINEESKENIYKLDKPTWIIDPVDGTTNLMYNYQHSAISVALFIEGKPYMGFIYDPYLKEMYFAQTGRGAYINGKSIKVSHNEKLENSLICFGTTPYDRSKTDSTFNIVKSVYSQCRDVRRSGSAALDLAYIACGRLDGFFEMTLQPWDFAAGMIILNEAGGNTSQWNGKKLDILKPCSVAATNCLIHSELLAILNEV
jgi:myo-inositol-1(or 4)-monophosphatase